jgi:hypothetical protein
MAARALYCGSDFTSYFSPRTSCHAVNFSSSSVWNGVVDWDVGYYKGECNSGEYVAGVAQSTSGALTHLLCCTGTALAKTSCATLTMTGTNTSNEPGDPTAYGWDPRNALGDPGNALAPRQPSPGMTTCGPGRYVAGVSRYVADTVVGLITVKAGAGHSIYCCTH